MKSVEEGPIVGTRVGRLRGMRESDLAVYRGIPYAAAPVGERHWRATEPHPGWMVVRDATVYGPIAPQPVGLPHDEVLGTRGRSADFFEVDQYPTMTFTSRRIELLDRTAVHYRVIGALTIRDVTREVSLDAWNVSPQAPGDRRLAGSLTTVLDRRDFGLTWSRPIQRIAEEVNISLSVQFIPVSSVV